MREDQRDTERHSRKRGHPQFPVVISRRPHPIPSRTRKLSSSEPMVLHGKPCGRVGRCRDYFSRRLKCLAAFEPFPFCSREAFFVLFWVLLESHSAGRALSRVMGITRHSLPKVG